MMRDVVIEEVGGTHVSFIAVFLILFGGAQLAMWVLFFVVATAFALLCGVVWLGVIISIAFIALGLGLLRRRDWAFTWTPVLMVVMIVLNIITIAVTPPSVIVFGPLIVVHALIGIGIMWERGKPSPIRRKMVRFTRPMDKEQTAGLICGRCGSADVVVYPDGSGICQACRNVFADIWKESEKD
jgi:hypothetical protein